MIKSRGPYLKITGKKCKVVWHNASCHLKAAHVILECNSKHKQLIHWQHPFIRLIATDRNMRGKKCFFFFFFFFFYFKGKERWNYTDSLCGFCTFDVGSPDFVNTFVKERKYNRGFLEKVGRLTVNTPIFSSYDGCPCFPLITVCPQSDLYIFQIRAMYTATMYVWRY